MSLLPYLLVVGEILNDPDGLEAIEVMIDSVGSTDDLWAWIEYLNLPEDGWSGTQVPELELTSVQAVSPFMFASFDPLSVLIPKAHAAPLKGKRVSVLKLRKLAKAIKQLDKGQNVTQGIKTLVESLKLPEAGTVANVGVFWLSFRRWDVGYLSSGGGERL